MAWITHVQDLVADRGASMMAPWEGIDYLHWILSMVVKTS